MTKDEVAGIVADAGELVAAYGRRNPTSQYATLAEKSALFNLWIRLKAIYRDEKAAA